MTTKENLLVVAIEECSELAQALTKYMRFGEGQDKDNINDIWIEYYQLKEMFEMLMDNQILAPCADEFAEMISFAKKRKVEKYAEHSRQLGLITD